MSETYQNTLDYLYGFVNFEHKRIEQYAPENVSLDRPSKLLALLGNPHHKFPAIHIAGTKGKGSVAAMTAACLRAAGYRVGLYTSPHLQEFRDRIRILTPEDGDGRISQVQVVSGVEKMKPCIEQVPGITWFELITALSFLHFAQEQIDVAVVEVGLGGRLDATNVLTPLISAITSISYDHTDLLGETLTEIAGEKAGIIKESVPVVSASQAPSALAKIEEVAQTHVTDVSLIGRDWLYEAQLSGKGFPRQNGRQTISITPPPTARLLNSITQFELALAGTHQQENAVIALAVLDAIAERFPKLSIETIQKGLATVSWPGRLQMLHTAIETPALLVDCAHNVDSAQKLAQTLRRDYGYQRLWLVLGATADKDVAGIVDTLVPLAEKTIMTTSGHPRAADPDTLVALAAEAGHIAQSAVSVSEAVLTAWETAAAGDLICVTGSIFVVGDLLNQWDTLQSQLRPELASVEI